MCGQLNQTYLDLNDSIPDQDLNRAQKNPNCESKEIWYHKIAFSFLTDNVYISCMIMLLWRTGLIGIAVYKQIQGQLNSSVSTWCIPYHSVFRT